MRKNSEIKENEKRESGITFIDSETLEHLKNIQSAVLRTWKGLNVKSCGQPGHASIVNKKYKK